MVLLLSGTTNSQFRYLWRSSGELEKNGLNAALANVAGGMELREIRRDQCAFSTRVFQCYRYGFPVEGNMVSLVGKGGRFLVSVNIDSTPVFATPPPVTGKAMWRRHPGTERYQLYSYSDSQGYRAFGLAGTKELSVKEDMHRYAGKDSWTMGWIFLPDPLSRNNFLYGNSIRDRKDSTFAEIEAEQVSRRIDCLFENDSFRLGNRWLKFGEVTPPVRSRAVTKAAMNFARNDERFEEVNAFYHISELSKWWDTLGLGMFKDTVVLDVHAYFGADESGFDPTASPPTIEFGDGGVDDAEDADAPVHEYTHAAFNHIIPNSYAGTQRKAMEEGICDFMALAYSHRFTQHQYGWVYNWDGHNEFWAGRNLDNTRYYPASLTNQEHVDGQLFGAALLDLADEIGFDSAVKIVMYTMPLMVPNISMLNGAKLLLAADSLFNEGRTRWPLVKALHAHGLLPDVGTSAPEKETMIVRNTVAFATGTGDLYLTPLVNGTLYLLDISGKVVLQIQVSAREEVAISPSSLSSGTYTLRCGSMAYKVLKF
jgi:hypothetical protein